MSPRSKALSKSMSDKSRKTIMDTALRLFATNGFHATSIRMISEKANISIGLTYNYFRSKEELLEAIIEEGLLGLHKLLNDIESQTQEEKLKVFVEKLFDNLQANLSFWRLYLVVLLQSEALPYAKPEKFIFFEHLALFFESALVKKTESAITPHMIITMLHGAFLQFALNENVELLNQIRNFITES